MTTKRVIDEIRESHGLTKTDAELAVEQVFGSLKKVLDKGEDVRFPGFGTFRMKHTPARVGRNFKTGADVPIPAKSAIAFKPSKGA